jgi:hypothetical protein
MDIFGPHYTELRLFLKKYLKMEMDDVVDVTIVRLTDTSQVNYQTSILLNVKGNIYKQPIWEIEVACRYGMKGERRLYDLENAVKKYIALFGEESYQIKLSRVFIVDETQSAIN